MDCIFTLYLNGLNVGLPTTLFALTEGFADGRLVGRPEGDLDGTRVGLNVVGLLVGFPVGLKVGRIVGDTLGLTATVNKTIKIHVVILFHNIVYTTYLTMVIQSDFSRET